jgi:hypothetical protein
LNLKGVYIYNTHIYKEQHAPEQQQVGYEAAQEEIMIFNKVV